MGDGQPHPKARLAGVGIDTHIAMMLPDNPVNRVEANAGSLAHRLGCKEWIEDAALDLRRNAGAIVDNVDQREIPVPGGL
jgi:trimethylamine:corrinoid methyltransferase-like protein